MDRVAIKKEAKEFAYANKWNIWKGLLLVSIFSFFLLILCSRYSRIKKAINKKGISFNTSINESNKTSHIISLHKSIIILS